MKNIPSDLKLLYLLKTFTLCTIYLWKVNLILCSLTGRQIFIYLIAWDNMGFWNKTSVTNLKVLLILLIIKNEVLLHSV